MILISSSDNPRFREMLGLAESVRDRRQAGLALLDGAHLVSSYVEHRGPPVTLVVSDTGRQRSEVAGLLARLPDVPVVAFSDGLFRRLSPVQTPTGIMAIIPIPRHPPPSGESDPCVLLDEVQDPGNLGSILRSTAAAGIRRVHLSAQCADLWSPKVLRAGMGAHFQLDCFTGVDLPSFADGYAGRLVATRLGAARSVFQADLTGPVALAFGNEGAGVSAALLERAAEVVAIPMPGGTESLNIAAAAAICLFERVRQLG